MSRVTLEYLRIYSVVKSLSTWAGMQNEFIQSLQMVTQLFFCHLQNLRAHKMSAVALDYQSPQNEFHALTKESFFLMLL